MPALPKPTPPPRREPAVRAAAVGSYWFWPRVAFFFGGAVAGVLIGALLRFDPPFAGAAVLPPSPPAIVGVEPLARQPEAPAASVPTTSAATPPPASPVVTNVEALPRAPLIPTVDVAELPQAPAAKHAATSRPVRSAPHRSHRRRTAPSSSVATAQSPATTGGDPAPSGAAEASAAAGILTKALDSF